VKAFSFSFSFISEATTMKAASTMPRHGGARNKAGYPKTSEQLVHRGQQPLFPPGAWPSLPNPRTSRGAPAISVEEARLKREARALHEEDRPERDATEKNPYAASGASSVAREVRERRFSDFGDDESDFGDEDITCFNREWWRRCCRMFTPARKDHARHIRLMHECITDTEPLKERNTDELRKCLLGLERKCEHGPFEELGDISLFQWAGRDCNGHDLWLRVRGSSRVESAHQNMSVVFDS
jgi:hypothetical protein